MLAASFPIHFGEAFADDGGFRVERVGFFVEIDCLCGVVGLAGVLELLLVDVAHCEIVVGVGPIGGFAFAGGGLSHAGFLSEERAWSDTLGRSLRLLR